MKFGVTVPNNFGVEDPQAVLEVAGWPKASGSTRCG